MGCRKNAYRALTELSEWMEDQKQKAAEAQQALQTQQRQVWTPKHLYDTCCAAWIAHGAETRMGRVDNAAAAMHTTRGCSGACGKVHVRLVLEWRRQNNVAVATAMPAMDPLVQYFNDLCRQGLAVKIIPGDENCTNKNHPQYQLKGFLQEHLDRLQAQTVIGGHLIKVKPTDLAASQRAHQRHVESVEFMQQAAKKHKGLQQQSSLLMQVLEICYHHSLRQHLTVADIAWMRLSNKTIMAPIAARLAKDCMRKESFQLAYSVLYNGVQCYINPQGEECLTRNAPLHAFSPEREGETCEYKIDTENLSVIRYQVYSCLNAMKLVDEDDKNNWYKRDTWHPDDKTPLPLPIGRPSSRSFEGHVIRVYLLPATHQYPEKDVFGTGPMEIARIRWDPFLDARVGLNRHGKMNVCLQQLQQLQCPEPTRSEESCALAFSIQQFTFGFGDLIGVYVRNKLPRARRAMQERTTPVPRAEKLYVKALAKAAREAPGNARDFEGFQGWW